MYQVKVVAKTSSCREIMQMITTRKYKYSDKDEAFNQFLMSAIRMLSTTASNVITHDAYHVYLKDLALVEEDSRVLASVHMNFYEQ